MATAVPATQEASRATPVTAADADALTRPFILPRLGYGSDAIEAAVDALTLGRHYTRHRQTYVTNSNAALALFPHLHTRPLGAVPGDLGDAPDEIREAVRNSGGGHRTHTLFWPSPLPAPGPASAEAGTTDAPGGAITSAFGSLGSLRRRRHRDRVRRSRVAR